MKDSFMEFLHVRVVERRKGFARVEGIVKEEYTNIHGTAHGGFLTSLADFALGLASNWEERRAAISIKMDFVTPAFVGDKLVAEAVEIGGGRKVRFYDLRVYRDGVIIAKGSAIVYTLTTRR